MGCLDKDRARRYGSARDLAEDLRRFRDGRPVRVRPVSAGQRFLRWCRRNPALAAAVVLAVAALTATAVVSTVAAFQQAEAARQIAGKNKQVTDALADSEKNRGLLQQTNADLVKTDKGRREALHRAGVLALERGVRLCEDRDYPSGMLWFARALEITPPEDADLQWLIRANLSGWRRFIIPVEARWDDHPDNSWVQTLAFSPDGKTVLVGSYEQTHGDCQVQLRDAATGKPVGAPLPVGAFGTARNTTAISPDGKRILTGVEGQGATVAVYGTPDLPKLLPHPGVVSAAAFSRDGKRFLTGSRKNDEKCEARLWDAAMRKPVGPPILYGGEVWVAALSPDGKTVAAGDSYTTARLWDAATGNPVGPPLEHPADVLAVAFSPDGETILTGCDDKNARLWDFPAPASGVAEKVTRWVEAVTGLKLGE